MSPQQDGSAPVKEREIEVEQAAVDAAYARLAQMREQAARRVRDSYKVAQGGTFSALVDRDVQVMEAAIWERSLENAYNELVFGRLDLKPETPGGELESYRIGRLGVRTEDLEPLVVDWRAPAAAAFYQAAPEDPKGVVRRRVLHCRGDRVLDIEDDLLDPDAAPEGLPVVGDGAFIAALSRTRTGRMRDIVATIQREQDLVIRAPADISVVVTGGPGTGKTAVALHRVAWLLFQHRRRFGSRGVLVVGPNRRFTEYIERVLPSLGEGGAALRSLGDVVHGVEAVRHEDPVRAKLKGSPRMVRILRKAANDAPWGAPKDVRLVYQGTFFTLEAGQLAALRERMLRGSRRPNAVRADVIRALQEAAWTAYQNAKRAAGDASPYDEYPDLFEDDKRTFVSELRSQRPFADFVTAWWPQRTPLEVLRSLGDPAYLAEVSRGVLSAHDARVLAESWRAVGEAGGGLSYSDVALLDELDALLGDGPRSSRAAAAANPYVVDGVNMLTGEEVDDGSDPESGGFRELSTFGDRAAHRGAYVEEPDPDEFGHIVVDEAQDLSPMQWRMLARRGRHATWTVVADEAQSSWEDLDEARRSMELALGDSRERKRFELTTNYRNPVEIADHAATLLHRFLPDAPLPRAVRSTGRPPVFSASTEDRLSATVEEAARRLAGEVEGTVGVIVPMTRLGGFTLEDTPERVQVLGALESKGLEFDAVVLVDPDRIASESPMGPRTHYVTATRATQALVTVSVE
ncbi:HelD family protein [Catenulispora subtropica]|uniref:AAA family ATPase n=1 Tax=Catenulispora subtropica TaxID=450798 RepID=A0ABP5CC35_9ACTN